LDISQFDTESVCCCPSAILYFLEMSIEKRRT
jgi:hypothetical protein